MTANFVIDGAVREDYQTPRSDPGTRLHGPATMPLPVLCKLAYSTPGRAFGAALRVLLDAKDVDWIIGTTAEAYTGGHPKGHRWGWNRMADIQNCSGGFEVWLGATWISVWWGEREYRVMMASVSAKQKEAEERAAALNAPFGISDTEMETQQGPAGNVPVALAA